MNTEKLPFWRRFWGHLRTITAHRHKVILHCAKAGILRQGLFHDLSKYSPTEFWNGVRYFNGHHSPNEDERLERGYSVAWMHHKGRNPHHWEYWTDFSMETKIYVAMPMPRRYLAEMICDRMAASKTYLGEKYTNASPLEYLMHGKMRDSMNRETEQTLRKFLTQLRDEGEDAMFASLRRWIKEEKDTK